MITWASLIITGEEPKALMTSYGTLEDYKTAWLVLSNCQLSEHRASELVNSLLNEIEIIINRLEDPQ